MGFFTDSELAVMTPSGCGHTCTLHRNGGRAPLLGKGGARILIVTEAPLLKELGMMLAKTLNQVGINLLADCWITPAVLCPFEDEPTKVQVEACRPNILEIIREKKPALIIMLGSYALSSIVGVSNPKIVHSSGKGFPLLCGKIFKDQFFPNTWLAVTLSPDYVNRTKFDPVVPAVWRLDFEQFITHLNEEDPSTRTQQDDHKACVLLNDPVKALNALTRVQEEKPLLAFDYETTGLKPHASGHRVVSIGFSPINSRSFAFRFPDLMKGTPWIEVGRKWRDIMADPLIKKVAHNLPFEWEWTHQYFKVTPRGWTADTQVLSHLEDSRVGHSSLKVQAYLKFGVPEYTGDVDRFKRSIDNGTGANAFNEIANAPVTEMLVYNALDALYTRRLFYWFVERGLADESFILQ